MADSVKRIGISEFRRLGFLQEANRQFFHPHGLALEVVIDDSGAEYLGGIWDCRDDPEGVYFADGMLEIDKARNVNEERKKHEAARISLFGGLVIQPIGNEDE